MPVAPILADLELPAPHLLPGGEELPCLVIGYGNDLRSDDAAGRRVAEMVDSFDLAGVRVVSSHQLTPEMAAEIAAASIVIFIDAMPASGGPRCRLVRLQEAEEAKADSHALTPEILLTLSRRLYGHTPEAWMVGIPAKSFELGQELSATASAGVRLGAEYVRDMLWIKRLVRKG